MKFKLRDTHLNELLKGSSIAFTLKVIGITAGYIFTLLITRKFGATAMGGVALSLTILQLFSILGRVGLDTALLKFVAEYYHQGKKGLVKEVYIKTLKIVLPLSLALSITLYFLSPYLAKHLFNKDYLSFNFKLISIAVIPTILTFINMESLRGLKRIKEYSFLKNVSNPLFAFFILVSLLNITKENHTPIIAYIIGSYLSAIVSFKLWFTYSPLPITSENNRQTINTKSLLGISFPMLLSSSMVFIMHWTDTIMLGIFRTGGEVGVYNVALKIAALTSITLFAVNSIAAPKFAELYGKNDTKGLNKIARLSAKLIFLSSLPIILSFILFPDFFLGLFGNEFKVGVRALIILTFSQFINAISGSVGYILIMTGKQKKYQNIILAATIINITLNLFFIPRYGINGAALASMISVAFWNMSAVVYIKKNFNILTLYIPFLKRYNTS